MLKQRVIDAYTFAQKAHEGQTRKFTGEPYFKHPKGVARSIEHLTRDEDMIIAALLHDVVEDCNVTILEIQEKFGKQVADYVTALTSNRTALKLSESKAKYLINKMSVMSVEELILKLADRADNIRYADKDCKTLKHKQFVRKYYNETREIIDAIYPIFYDKLDKNDALRFLFNAINLELDFLRIKYMWE